MKKEILDKDFSKTYVPSSMGIFLYFLSVVFQDSKWSRDRKLLRLVLK